jgi:hypothetical protein
MDRDDPEQRIAELENQPVKSSPERRRPGRWGLVIILICAALPLYHFGYAAYDLYGYSAGTPTTAMVTKCVHHGSSGRHGGLTRALRPLDCRGTWTVEGRKHTGGIEGPRGGYQVGSTVDVHVRGDKAFTTVGASWRFLAGAIALLIPALLLVYWLWIGRAGARYARRHSTG